MSEGLRVRRIEAKDWKSTFYISGYGSVSLPESAPPCFDNTFWANYKTYQDSERPHFSGYFSYGIESLSALPGLDQWKGLDPSIKETFAVLVLRSLPRWHESWRKTTIRKMEGQSHSYYVESSLHSFLRDSPWFVSHDGNKCQFFRPWDSWYIDRRILAGRFHQFAHLRPLSPSIAAEVDANPELVPFLKDLGMPVYDLEKPSNDRRLLTALADALQDPESIADQNVFLGQVRDAWRIFRPGTTEAFPDRIFVHRGPGKRDCSIP